MLIKPPPFHALSTMQRPHLHLQETSSSTEIQGIRTVTIGGQGDARLTWECDHDEVVVSNDRYGLIPTYYCYSPTTFAISTNIHSVLHSSPTADLDYPALSVFLRLGHFLEDDTPFAAIRTVPAATTLSWRRGCISISKADNKSPSTDPISSFTEAADGYATLFQQAINRRLPDSSEFVVPLSGGRDSRHILFELIKQGHIPDTCPTVEFRPPSTNEDIRIASAICSRLGIHHVKLPKPDNLVAATLRDIELTDHCGAGHAWSLPLADYVLQHPGTIYDGLGGDVLSGGHTLSALNLQLAEEGRHEELAISLLTKSNAESFIRAICSSDFQKKIPLDLAVDRLTSALKQYANTNNPLVSFVFWNRTRRAIGQIPFGIMQQHPAIYAPFLDEELYDFLIRIDPHITLNNKLHDHVIRQTYPDFADIPFERKPGPILANRHDKAFYRETAKEFLKYLLTVRPYRSSLIKRSQPIARAAIDMLRGPAEPWYMAISMRLIELEKASSLALTDR